MLSPHRRTALAREPAAAIRVPYAAHVAERIVKTSQGDYVQAFRLAGIGFECSDDALLNAWHERLNVLWRNLASPRIAVWTHLVRRRASGDAPTPAPAPTPIREPTPLAAATASADFAPSPFARDLEYAYRRRVAVQTLLNNEIYLAVVYRAAGGAAGGVLRSLFARGQAAETALDVRDALDTCAKVGLEVRASLARYEPAPLGVYREGGRWCSSLLEYLALLVNGEWQPMPLPRGPIADALVGNRLLFGHEAIEYRAAARTRVGAMLGIKEYPTPCYVGMFDKLLSAPFPLIATQSFAFLTKSAAQALLQRQFNRMANAGDFAVSQAEELKDALDALTSNEFVMGDHHFSLQVLADADDGGATTAADRLKPLNDRVAIARSLLADTGMLVAREDLALEAAFWAQLPGNAALRPRKAPITSRNFAAMAPFHNYPGGRASGNHWGEALTLLKTTARTPFHFSLHASDPADGAGAARRDTGHTLICGPTGSGKTVFIGFLVAMLHRQAATQVIFDKDHGLEILVRALGGEYLPLANGAPTGFNPLQLPATPATVEFLKSWLHHLATQRRGAPAAALSVREIGDLDRALRGTLALEAPLRRLSRLVEFLDPTDPEGLHARLGRWSGVAGGEYAWVFDNPQDTIVPRLSGRSVIGFDVTEFLGNDAIRAPITLYLFHLVRSLLDGRRFVCWMDEFWRLVADPAFEDFAKDAPKTWRKLNAVLCLATQSASDVLSSSISRTLIEQTPTKIFFPNADADLREYTEGLGLSEREFQMIKTQIEPGSRRFLVKQSHLGVVCELDLEGFGPELAVISGRAAHLRRMRELIAARGADPAGWLAEFMQSGPRAPGSEA
ncbi:MAG: VirB4 family type IV secretion/conjugal transfer ATPase [Gammaproteobacteria bacterium]|nr:VirB4 family type IV secretion/conjugal transfer ATPase [Gammaproteobacteria bacterium]